jgi:lysyl-tRNA synthetase class 1
MFWADKKADEIVERFGKGGTINIRDEKTVSGRVHVGSMRGVVIHGVLDEILQERGVEHTFKYEFNDFDPMDDLPGYLDAETFTPYLGMPLCRIPSPDGTAANFAEFFANDFRGVILEEGYTPDFYYSSELYVSGKMDTVIREALEGAATIRRIYEEVSGGKRNDDWLPLSVVCPSCGKMSTTEATDFDGQTVAVYCRPNKVDWTNGCDFRGRVSPFGGNAKLPWKVEWPAKWKVMNVHVEGAGKDHSTKGGSRDVANHIAREVFNYEPPFDVPYEFFLVGGKKMSSSKGRGSSARDIADLVPPHIFRLALLSKDINQAINFDPEGDTIPVLYDLYDKFAQAAWGGVQDDYSRLFGLLHASDKLTAEKSSGRPIGLNQTSAQPVFLARFSQVAFIVQMPHMNLEAEVEKMKGSALTDADKLELAERAAYAKRWIGLFAPEKFVFKLQDTLPEVAATLNASQKLALADLAKFIGSTPHMPSGEDMHAALHNIKEARTMQPAKMFGPKAGWFLSVLNRDMVLARLAEAAA